MSPGTGLGQYELIAALGSGGMAEVYCARGSKLGLEARRSVAKHPPAAFLSMGRTKTADDTSNNEKAVWGKPSGVVVPRPGSAIV